MASARKRDKWLVVGFNQIAADRYYDLIEAAVLFHLAAVASEPIVTVKSALAQL